MYAKFIADFYDDLPKRIAFRKPTTIIYTTNTRHTPGGFDSRRWSASDRVGFVHLNSYFQSSETTGASTGRAN